jgi:acyl-CoA thioester hydrolase
MARIKINLPDKFIFATKIPIRINDINYGGHLRNDSILSIVHEARVRFLKKFGYSELNVEGCGIIMSDSAIVYKSEGYYGDVLRIEVTIDDFSKFGCDFIYKISNKETNKEIARAKTGIVFFDYENKKMVEVPEKFKTVLSL